MSYPKRQYVLGRTRGTKTSYFYGTKLGDLIRAHVKVGDQFVYATLTKSPWRLAFRSSEASYRIESLEAVAAAQGD